MSYRYVWGSLAIDGGGGGGGGGSLVWFQCTVVLGECVCVIIILWKLGML